MRVFHCFQIDEIEDREARAEALCYPPIVIQPIDEEQQPPEDETSRKRSLSDVTDDDAPAAKRAHDAV